MTPQPPLTDLTALVQAAEWLKTLAHPHRLRMLEMLLQNSYAVGALAEACDIPSPMASAHLRLMQRCGILTQQREGRNTYYRIAEPAMTNLIACVRERFASSV